MKASSNFIPYAWYVILPSAFLLGVRARSLWVRLCKLARLTLLALALIIMAVEGGMMMTNWSFRNTWLHNVCLALTYLSATCLVLVDFREITTSPLSLVLRVGATAVAAFVFYGLLLTWWQNDSSTLAGVDTPLGDQLVSRRTSGGWAGIDWEGVEIVRQPIALPWIEKRLYAVRIGDAGDCNESTVAVVRDTNQHEIQIQCGRKNPYVVARVRLP